MRVTDDQETELLALTGRVRDTEDRLDAMETVASAVNDKLDEWLLIQAARPTNFHWGDLDPADAQARWTALLEWLQNVLVARYPAAADALRPCWWQHLDVVDVVTATWLTWLAAYRSGDADATDAGNWHRTYYPHLVEMANTAMASCNEGKHEPDGPSPVTMNTVPTTI